MNKKYCNIVDYFISLQRIDGVWLFLYAIMRLLEWWNR